MTDAGALAAVDCGTNSTRLLVVGAAGDTRAREMKITRLGEGVDATHQLLPEAMDRTFSALRAYRTIMDAEGVDQTRLVATSAVRDAGNGEGFLQSAADIVGAPAELLSGQEEGRLSYAGATAELVDGSGRLLVVDIGGGSTEVTTAQEDTATIRSYSMDVGCVRLTERILRSDPPTASQVAQAVDTIGTELASAELVMPELAHLGPTRLVGLAGTVSTLASLELGLADYDRELIHHAELSLEAVERWCDVLAGETFADRAQRPGLPNGRQDVIFGGALVLRELMRRLELHTCIVSESDILDGLVMSLR